MTAGFVFRDGVYQHPSITATHRHFEGLYNAVRERESRRLTVEQVRRLPEINADHPDRSQWLMRANTAKLLRRYIKRNGASLNILEVGCGTGFLSHLFAEDGHHVTATDINLDELRTAASAFGDTNPTWCYMDLMTAVPPGAPFDVVVFAASLQYFQDPEAVIRRCQTFTKPGGELHIVDSPFYDRHTAEAARRRSRDHFAALGNEELIAHYFHHTYDSLSAVKWKQRGRLPAFLGRLIGYPQSPFPWIIIKF